MRLVSFRVTNYRSIEKAKIPTRGSTILIGPNNQGKSNLLRALVTGLTIVSQRRFPVSARVRVGPIKRHYDWDVDFPMALQAAKPSGATSLRLEFQLDETEIAQFKDEVKSSLNGTLPIELRLGRESFEYRVVKKGPGGTALSKKRHEIASFIARRLDFQYVPAVRTAKAAENVVEEIVARELLSLEDNSEYQTALAQIDKLQAPLLKQISESIQETLQEFLPAVANVKVSLSAERRHAAFRRASEIIVDDGTPTELRHKGDGVQSLAAMSLMRHATERGARGRDLILAVEEPESHLHPKAIHRLRGVIEELARKHQVIVASHCPLFVDRKDIGSNILVTRSRARPARSVAEIRDTLGVRAADNLQHAELVLLVEGTEDVVAVGALLSARSSRLRKALSQGQLAIDALGGGTNLAYKVGLVKDSICDCHAFMDNDDSGRDGFEKARLAGLLADADCHFATTVGGRDSELEDLYDPKLYAPMLQNGYQVTTTSPKFKTAKKWSLRLGETFRQQGKQWNDRIEAEVKAAVAELVSANPANAVLPAHGGTIDGLVGALESKLG